MNKDKGKVIEEGNAPEHEDAREKRPEPTAEQKEERSKAWQASQKIKAAARKSRRSGTVLKASQIAEINRKNNVLMLAVSSALSYADPAEQPPAEWVNILNDVLQRVKHKPMTTIGSMRKIARDPKASKKDKDIAHQTLGAALLKRRVGFYYEIGDKVFKCTGFTYDVESDQIKAVMAVYPPVIVEAAAVPGEEKYETFIDRGGVEQKRLIPETKEPDNAD